MRVLLLLLALVGASILWLGAAPPPTFPTPVVVVFPLTVNGDADKESGSRLAVIFAQQMSENGVKVVAPPPGTERGDFLTVARKLGCDYYVSGFVTPLGAEVSVVEQVVSTVSGTVIASNSAQLLTYADANGQGVALATLVRHHAARALASLGEAPPAATPAPKESQAEANISGLGKIFKRKPKAEASASPAASAAAAASVAPSPRAVARATAPAAVPTQRATAVAVVSGNGPRVVVFDIGGSATTNVRRYARDDLQTRLAKSGHSVSLAAAVAPEEVVSRAASLCSENAAKTLVDAQLVTRSGDSSYGPNTIAQLDIRAVDCSGQVLLNQRFERDSTGNHNVERAVDKAVGAAVIALTRAIR